MGQFIAKGNMIFKGGNSSVTISMSGKILKQTSMLEVKEKDHENRIMNIYVHPKLFFIARLKVGCKIVTTKTFLCL